MEECSELPNAQIITTEGTRAYYIESGSSTKLAVTYHGNGERACDSAEFVNWLTQHEYNVLVVEFSGYASDRSRKPSVELLLRDTEHIAVWVKERNFSDLLIVGRSIGAGFASYHASLASPQKLLLISPFDTLSQTTKAHYPVYPTSLLLKTELDNIANAAFGKEILIIHGTEDVIIPFERGKALYEKLPQEKKTFLPIPGHAHNDVLDTAESWSAIASFLKEAAK
jgi:alpha-beta hydrolase superfamily lysophospholipase